MPDQNQNESESESFVRTYRQDAFSTTIIFLFLALLSTLFFYMAWDQAFGPPTDPKEYSSLSTRIFMSTPKGFRIIFFATLGSILVVPGVGVMWKLFARPSVLIIGAAGVEYRKSLRQRKFISWTEMKELTFHKGTAQFRDQGSSIDVLLFIHGVGQLEILRDVEHHRPDLVKKFL
jgi:hypothetical protein